jgi:phosphoribosyl 1,2-cyclic phosphate phosphodiesterase
LEVIERLCPERAFLTHISHEMGLHAEVDAELPKGVSLAYDNLEVEI